MKTADPTYERAKEMLTDLASRVTGFRRDSFQTGAIEKILKEMKTSGTGVENLIQETVQESPELVSRLAEAVPVGETYFFRQPEHFHYLAKEVLPSLKPGPIKVLSAGCATGEEAYSLAACLESFRPGAEVLATDLSKRHLEKAQKGVYGSWSLRGTREELFPVFGKSDQATYHVRPELKERVCFLRHNLLDPLPEGLGPFDVIFCRNVLVYFTPDAAREVLKNLSSALSPEGLLFLGPTDIPFAPPGFKPRGPSELSVYEKGAPSKAKGAAFRKAPSLKSALAPLPPLKPGKKSGRLAKPKEKTGPLALHLLALESIEKENHPEASRQLKQLCQRFPDYLPGLYEAALWNARNRKKDLAQGLMREILKRLKGKKQQEVLRGPQDLTVDFYRVSARTFLARKEA